MHIKTARDCIEAYMKNKLITGFLPTAITKKVGITYNEAVEECMVFVKKRQLKLVYELFCPKCFMKLNSVDEIEEVEVYCYRCDQEFETTKDDYSIYFKKCITPL